MKRAFLLMTVFALPACGVSGVRGELGQGVFDYECVDETDLVCEDFNTELAAGQDIALGAQFSMSARDAEDGSSLRVDLATSDRLDDRGRNIFEAIAPGYTAIMAFRGDRLIDLLHVNVAEIGEVRFDVRHQDGEEIEGVSALNLEVGREATIQAVPLPSTNGIELAGAIGYDWQSSNPTVLSITGSTNDNTVNVQAVGDGSVNLTITMGDATQTLTVAVAGGGEGGAGGDGGGGGQGGGGQGGGGGAQ
jgi:hypothetical protein